MLNVITGLGDSFTPAFGTAAWAGDAFTFTKDEIAIFACRRLQNEAE
jgi:hypothetical protein